MLLVNVGLELGFEFDWGSKWVLCFGFGFRGGFLIWIRGKLSWDWIGAFTLDIQEGAGFSPGQGPRNN